MASTVRPHLSPASDWKPPTSGTVAPSVLRALSQGLKATPGARGDSRFHEPWVVMSAPLPITDSMGVLAVNASPSGALCAGRPSIVAGRPAQSSLSPLGLNCGSLTNGTLRRPGVL